MKIFLWFVLALVLVTGSRLSAQEVSHLFVPYGSILPYLSEGEYVISAWGNLNSSRSTRTYDTLSESYESRYDNISMTARGVYAVTDQLLLALRLTFYPAQTWNTYNYTSSSYTSRSSDKLQSFLMPDISVVVRPTRFFELNAGFGYSSRTILGENSYGYPPSPSFRQTAEEKDTGTNFTFGINLFGRL
jgi:hypothetical protein